MLITNLVLSLTRWRTLSSARRRPAALIQGPMIVALHLTKARKQARLDQAKARAFAGREGLLRDLMADEHT